MWDTNHIKIKRGLSAAVIDEKAIGFSLQNDFNSFLVERLEGIPFIGINKPNEAVTIKAKKKAGFSIAFDVNRITEEDSKKVIKVLKESVIRFNLQPLINWDKGKGVYVFNVFIK